MLTEIKSIRKTLRSGIHDGTHVTAGGLGLTETLRGETGRVEISGTIDSNNTSTMVKFKKEYESPVVVAYVITRNGGQSVEARVKDVTSDSCVIFLEEPDDENHNPETIGYIVLEKGSHITENGYRIEAGLHKTSKARRGGQTDFTGDEIKFSKMFKSNPAILHTLNTYNNNTFATTMVQNVTPDGFELSQELAETKKPSAEEDVAWIAFETMVGKGFITGIRGQVGIVEATRATGVDNAPGITIDLSAGFKTRPDIVVKGQTMNGSDGYWARGAGAWSSYLVKTFAEEDQRSNTERSHTVETFAFAAFENGSEINTIRKVGYKTSDVYKLSNIDIRYPLVTVWESNNYNAIGIQVKVSKDYGVSWSDWLTCEYAKQLPELPTTGELDGIEIKFKYTFFNDVEVISQMSEFRVETNGTVVIIEGNNVGGLAKDGSDWNSKRII